MPLTYSRIRRFIRTVNDTLHTGGEGLFCNPYFDTVTGWPRSPAGQLATLHCPTELNGLILNPNGNVTRQCLANGSWEPRSDYSNCYPIMAQNNTEMDVTNDVTRIIYNVGYSVSITALVVALCIFMYFRSLRCVRNTIHCHLMVTFVLRNLVWLILNSVAPTLILTEENVTHQWIWMTMMVIYNYLQVTNFFWMLVEGLYLHTLIVWAYSTERLKFWIYALVGWGAPAVIVGIWAIVMATVQSEARSWVVHTNYNYIYIAPILAVLFGFFMSIMLLHGVLMANIVFLGSIVWVLITKLRASNIWQIKQYRKAVKATLFLFPLLGVTYVIFITPPGDSELSQKLFMYINAILQATQGLAIAVFYCFINEEVRSTIRMKLSRWRDGRSVSTRYTRASTATNLEQLSLARLSINLPSAPLIAANGKLPKNFAKNNNDNGIRQTEMTILNGR